MAKKFFTDESLSAFVEEIKTYTDDAVATKADASHTHTNASLGQGRGYCSTASATTAKVASCSNYVLKTGGIVAVYFVYSVPASSTLNVNDTGAKSIYYQDSAIVADVIKGGDTATFMFDGSYYRLISNDRWHEDITDLQATDGKVKQVVTSANANYRLLLTPDSQTATTTAQTYFNTGLYANPSTGKIYANISGTASGLSSTLDIASGGTGATDAETARTNLDVYSTTEVDSLVTSLGLPEVTEADNGKILQVVNGKWALVDIFELNGTTLTITTE